MSRLERFKSAQNASHAGFEAALDEIRTGRKAGHWIWYIFPQLSGLGSSALSQLFAIDGEAEAVEYLQDPELRSRLVAITTAVAEQLRTGNAGSLRALMGSDVDTRKIVSSLTLFEYVARKLDGVAGKPVAAVAGEVLDRAASEGYVRCAYTLRVLQRTD